MTKVDHYYRDLLRSYLENRCSPKEYREVMDFLENDSSNRLLLLHMKEQFHGPEEENSQISSEQSERMREALFNKITEASEIITTQDIKEAPVISIDRQRRWQLAAVAAAVIMIIGISFYFKLFQKKYNNSVVANTETRAKRFKNDVFPGGDKALLTLADGTTIILDDAQNGALAQQGNTKVIKVGGKLAYDPANAGTNKVLYNTIATPRGGQYQIELPDGSQVWLNAASSLRFPTSFVDKERRVEITGEGYFEVAKNKAMPFIVSVNGAEVQVLGTHFNVMAYQDEAAVKTTLLEGSVQFVSGNNKSLLKPGQQSQLNNVGQVKVVNDVDVEEVMSWKNGMFYFDNEDLESVMRQVSRWYDVEVVYQTKKEIKRQLIGEIPRSSKLSDVLKVLELTSNHKFEIDGNRVIVKM